LLTKIIAIYEKELNNEEAEEVMALSLKDFRYLITECFAPWAKENQIDTTELVSFVNEKQPWETTKSGAQT